MSSVSPTTRARTVAVADQLTLDLPREGCQYGIPQPGEVPRCTAPATHAAVSVHARAKVTARVECCRDHANYYATAWAAPHVLYYPVGMTGDATWIEVLR